MRSIPSLQAIYPRRQLHSKNNDDGVSNSTTQKSSTTGMSLCQINNHPDFRLSIAKERLGQIRMTTKRATTAKIREKKFPLRSSIPNYKNTEVKENGLRVDVLENPIRSNDGTSSGALINDRLRDARRRMIEKLKTPIVIEEEATISSTEQLHSIEDDKMAQEKFLMEMWKDAGNEMKRLRGELKGETDKDTITDIQADIRGLRKRKAEFAKLLKMEE